MAHMYTSLPSMYCSGFNFRYIVTHLHTHADTECTYKYTLRDKVDSMSEISNHDDRLVLSK